MGLSFDNYNQYDKGIRNFIVGIVVKISSDEQSMRREKSYMNKLNLALVQVCLFVDVVLVMHIQSITTDTQTRMAPQLADVHT